MYITLKMSPLSKGWDSCGNKVYSICTIHAYCMYIKAGVIVCIYYTVLDALHSTGCIAQYCIVIYYFSFSLYIQYIQYMHRVGENKV